MDRINQPWFYFSLLLHYPPPPPLHLHPHTLFSPLLLPLLSPLSLSVSPTPLSGLQTEEMHKFRHISIPVRLPISRQGLAPFRLSSLSLSLSLFHFPSPDLFLNHLSSTECIYLFPKPSLNYFGASWCFSFVFLKGEYSFILSWHGQLYTAIAFEMRFICFWLCVCVWVYVCHCVLLSGPAAQAINHACLIEKGRGPGQ